MGEVDALEIYLIRHAKAESPDPARWPNDDERPLTPQGQMEFARMLKTLGDLPSSVDLFVSSPLLRAKQTADILVSERGWPNYGIWQEMSPDADPQETLDRLFSHRSLKSVALVGHLPHIPAFLSLLLTGSSSALSVEYKKGAIARVTMNHDDGKRGALVWLAVP